MAVQTGTITKSRFYISEKTMDSWVSTAIIIIVLVIIIGNLSTFQKNSKQPLRKKGLNDLKETLPRTHKKEHKLPTVNDTKINNTSPKNN